MADSELTKMLQERLSKRADNQAGWHPKPVVAETPAEPTDAETPDAEVEAVETPATPEAPATPVESPATPATPSIKDVLAKQGLAVEGQSDEDLGKQLVNVLAEREELRRQQEEMRQQLEQLQQKSATPAPPPAPAEPQPQTREQKLKKWNKVEIDQSLVRFCDYDNETSKFIPNAKYGNESVKAAETLNSLVAEQQRRSQLMVNDPNAALEEAGIFDELDNRYEQKFKQWQQQFVTSLQEKQQQAIATRQMQQQQAEVDAFYKSIEKEVFKVGADGKPLVGLDGGQVPTERGLLLREKVHQLCQDLEVDQPDLRIWKAAYKLLPPVEPPKAPEPTPEAKKEQVKEKKTQFVEQARKKPEKKPLSVTGAFAQPLPEQSNRKQSFKDMLVKDPENAEILGTFYEGA